MVTLEAQTVTAFGVVGREARAAASCAAGPRAPPSCYRTSTSRTRKDRGVASDPRGPGLTPLVKKRAIC